jgi:farnesyl diphosphate synthase
MSVIKDPAKRALQAMTASAEAVERMLNRLLPKVAGPEAGLAEAMRYATLGGGKRLRPFLVIASADLFGVARDCSLRVGSAVECIHAYSLIHDDLPCMDDDDMRRGKPSTHKQFDEATAVLAGDALLTLAFEILSDEKVHPDPHVRCELIQSLAKAIGAHGMVGGQMIDLTSENEALDIMAITRLQQMKTGALISFSAEAGAILGRAPVTSRNALRGYAHDMGLAFQIADDLLDVEGTPEMLGKTPGKDAKAGKATLVSALGIERARMQAQMLTQQSMRHLDHFGDKSALLREVALFAVNRDK